MNVLAAYMFGFAICPGKEGFFALGQDSASGSVSENSERVWEVLGVPSSFVVF